MIMNLEKHVNLSIYIFHWSRKTSMG